MDGTDIKEAVKEKYGEAALRVNSGGSSCCGAAAASGPGCDPITANLYELSQAQQIPEEALLASLGSGRGGTRPRFRRRDRCPALRPACRTDG